MIRREVQDNNPRRFYFIEFDKMIVSILQCKYYKIIEIILRKKSKFERLLPDLKT